MAADIIVNTFFVEHISLANVPIITVYGHPADYPDKYIARLFDGAQPTEYIAVADNLEDLRKSKPTGSIILGRSRMDSNKIIESWI